MGNHEHYSGRWNRTEEVLREEFNRYTNINLLEQNKFVLDDIVFLGASLWTNFNNHDPLTMFSVKDLMNDYKSITEFKNGVYHKLTPKTTLNKHTETVDWLRMMLAEDKRKTVVIGHHAPSMSSVHPRYQNQQIMNGAFCSNLESLILDNDHIALWTHGHVHDFWNYNIGNTKIICNPRGYPGERSNWDPDLLLEI